MVKPRRDPNKPPEWFGLSKYVRARILPARDWAIQIDIRLDVFSAGDPLVRQTASSYCQRLGLLSAEDFAGYKEELRDAIRERGGNPIVFDRHVPNSAVEALTPADAFYYADKSGDLRLGYDLLNSPDRDPTTAEETEAVRKVCEPIPIIDFGGYWFPPEFLIKVDLTAPDDKVCEDLRQLLAQTRRTLSLLDLTKKRFTRATARQWAEAGLLPYLDLVAWREDCGDKIPDHLLSGWIFPDAEVNAAEKLRNVTKKLARHTMNGHVVEWLLKQ